MLNIIDCTNIGTIRNTYGNAGNIVIRIDNYPNELIQNLNYLLIKINQRLIPFFIIDTRIRHKNNFIVDFEDITTKIKANELLKKEVYIENDKTSKFDKKENNTLEDFIGFNLIDKEYGEIGCIKGLINYSSNSIFKVTFKNKEIFIPASKDFFLKINKEQKEIKIDLPIGLLDIY